MKQETIISSLLILLLSFIIIGSLFILASPKSNTNNYGSRSWFYKNSLYERVLDN